MFANMSKKLSLLSLLLTTPLLAQSYQPLCVDLGRRMIQQKIQTYRQLSKMVSRTVATSQTNFKFESLPAVVSPQIDFAVAKVILQNEKSQKTAKSFDEKMNLEERLLAVMQKQMSAKDGKLFLQRCENLYTSAAKFCKDKRQAKSSAQNAQCVQQYVGVESPYLQKIVPFAAFAVKWEKRYKRLPAGKIKSSYPKTASAN